MNGEKFTAPKNPKDQSEQRENHRRAGLRDAIAAALLTIIPIQDAVADSTYNVSGINAGRDSSVTIGGKDYTEQQYHTPRNLGNEVDLRVEMGVNTSLDQPLIRPKSDRAEYIDPRANTEQYTVQSGDSVSKIAQKYRLSMDDLLLMNPQIANRADIKIGQKINVSKQTIEPTVHGRRVLDVNQMPQKELTPELMNKLKAMYERSKNID
jgi:LysM repeat protein